LIKRQKIKHLLASGKPGDEVFLCGWVRSKRTSKACAFIALNDGSCQGTIQLVVDNDSEASEKLTNIGTGAGLGIAGVLVESPAKGQAVEVQVKDITVYGEAGSDYPLQKKGHSVEFLREIAHLRPRTNAFGAMFRVRNSLANATHEYFQKKEFIWAHTPLLTASDGEGAGEMFQVTTMDLKNPPLTDKGQIDYSKDFFGKKAHLAVTGQLEAEFMALSLGDVYTFGPTFRAENSNTTRHLSEFWMIEPEMAFADLDDNIELAYGHVTYMMNKVLEECPEELQFFEKFFKGIKIDDFRNLVQKEAQRVTYTDAISILKNTKKKFENPVEWGIDLSTEHERFLAEEHFKGPVFVTDYPKDIKAFYMRLNDDEKTVAATDLLVPGVGELIGGSQREERLDVLDVRMNELGVPKEDLQWYLDLRRYGSVPHAGYGLGFERMVMYMTGMGNIRDTIPCPRVPNFIEF
jgi:asparaginyl-tRNA synthetase